VKKITLSIVLLIILLISFSCADSTDEVTVFSPDARASITINSGSSEGLNYSITFNDKELIQKSPIYLEFTNMSPLNSNLSIMKVAEKSVDEKWEPKFSKSSEAINRYNEVIISLKENGKPARVFNIEVRAYNEGIAFRYFFPEQESFEYISLSNEKTAFKMGGDFLTWAANYKQFRSHQESEFTERNVSAIGNEELIGLPLLADCGENCWMAITEANLRNWAGMYLRRDSTDSLNLTIALSPHIDNPEIAVEAKTPVHSPWRTIMLGESPGELIESNLILNLSDESEISDDSWIEPGISVWDQWWPGAYAPDADFEVGMNTETIKYYADFAHEMGYNYLILDFMWYGNPYIDSVSWKPDPSADITTASPDVDMPEVLKYTADRDIKLILWLHWVHAEEQMDEAFRLYEDWGIGGLKIDMMARDDQFMVNWYEKVLKKAAEHRLAVVFHGSYKPTGLRRTLPNLLTREGVLGNEYNKTTQRITPEHNLNIPYTRMLAGPMDYTPGGFRHKRSNDFQIQPGPGRWQKTPPFVMGTRCHQLAMLVVYESPLQILCDSPYNYKNQPGTDFLKLVPTTWDETRVLDGYPGDFIVVARRKYDIWYVAGMTGMEKRHVEFGLGFMDQADYHVQIWKDHELANKHPEKLNYNIIQIGAGNIFSVEMAPEGGFVAIFKSEDS
jgi:alpha-glucosidase